MLKSGAVCSRLQNWIAYAWLLKEIQLMKMSDVEDMNIEPPPHQSKIIYQDLINKDES